MRAPHPHNLRVLQIPSCWEVGFNTWICGAGHKLSVYSTYQVGNHMLIRSLRGSLRLPSTISNFEDRTTEVQNGWVTCIELSIIIKPRVSLLPFHSCIHYFWGSEQHNAVYLRHKWITKAKTVTSPWRTPTDAILTKWAVRKHGHDAPIDTMHWEEVVTFVLFFPQIPILHVTMRRHWTVQTCGTFYKVMDQYFSKMPRPWKTRKAKEQIWGD